MKSLYKTLSFIISTITLLNSLMSLITTGLVHQCVYSRPGNVIESYDYSTRSVSTLKSFIYNASLSSNCNDSLRSEGPYKKLISNRVSPADFVITEYADESIIEYTLLLTNHSSHVDEYLDLVVINSDGPSLFKGMFEQKNYTDGECIYQVGLTIYDRLCDEPNKAKSVKFFVYLAFVILIVFVEIITIIDSPVKFYLKIFFDFLKTDFEYNFRSCNTRSDNALYLDVGSSYLIFTNQDTNTFNNFKHNKRKIFKINKKTFHFHKLCCYIIEDGVDSVKNYIFLDVNKVNMFKNYLEVLSASHKNSLLDYKKRHCLCFDEVVKKINDGKFISIFVTDDKISAYGEDMNPFDLCFIKKIWRQFNKKMSVEMVTKLLKHNIYFFGSLNISAISLVFSKKYFWYNRPNNVNRKQWENYTSQISLITGWKIDHQVTEKSKRIANIYKNMSKEDMEDFKDKQFDKSKLESVLLEDAVSVIKGLKNTLDVIHFNDVNPEKDPKTQTSNTELEKEEKEKDSDCENNESLDSKKPKSVEFIKDFNKNFIETVPRTFKDVVISRIIEGENSALKREYVSLDKRIAKMEKNKNISEDEINNVIKNTIMTKCGGITEDEFIEINDNHSLYKKVTREAAIRDLVEKTKIPVFNYFSCLRNLYENNETKDLSESIIPENIKDRGCLVEALDSLLKNNKKREAGKDASKSSNKKQIASLTSKSEGKAKLEEVREAKMSPKEFTDKSRSEYIGFLKNNLEKISPEKMKKLFLDNYDNIVFKTFNSKCRKKSKKGRKSGKEMKTENSNVFMSSTYFLKMIKNKISLENPSKIIKINLIKSLTNIVNLSRKHLCLGDEESFKNGNYFCRKSLKVIKAEELIPEVVKMFKDSEKQKEEEKGREKRWKIKEEEKGKGKIEIAKSRYSVDHSIKVTNYSDGICYLMEGINLRNILNSFLGEQIKNDGGENALLMGNEEFVKFLSEVTRGIVSEIDINTIN